MIDAEYLILFKNRQLLDYAILTAQYIKLRTMNLLNGFGFFLYKNKGGINPPFNKI